MTAAINNNMIARRIIVYEPPTKSTFMCAVSVAVSDSVKDEESFYCLQPVDTDCNCLSKRSDFIFNMFSLPARYGFDDWDGNGAEPLSSKSFEFATCFADKMPARLPNPRIVVDPDGDVCFKWCKSKFDKVEVTFSQNGECYAIVVAKGMTHSSLTTSFTEVTQDIERVLGW